jgi:hypothetical protein
MSGLGVLMTCPLRMAITINSTSSEAADTGSLVHAGVAAWHKSDQSSTRGLTALRKAVKEHPLGKIPDAVKHFQAYIQDPANQEAKIIAVEEAVELTLSGATGPIHLLGHLDQIRDVDGRWGVFDVKTGRLKGFEMMQVALYQIAGYSVAASEKYGREVHPGAIIRTRGYLEHTSVFFNYTLTLDHAKQLLSRVVHVVDAIREGGAWPVPGPYCYQCSAKAFDVCVPEYLGVSDGNSNEVKKGGSRPSRRVRAASSAA